MKHLLFSTIVLLLAASLTAQQRPPTPCVGIAINMSHDSLVTAAGYCCIIESINSCVSPRQVSEADFQANLVRFKGLKTPIAAFNLFIPADLKLVGPSVDEQAVLAYAETVLRRISQTDTRLVVWGSGGARRVPDGFDKKLARKQFVAIARKIAAIAGKYQIILALENLNSTETNFINTVAEALDIVKKVDHPNFRLNADLYHMMKEGEAPDILKKTKKYLVHVEIAEPAQRTVPGIAGTDFRPYLSQLARIGYHQRIVIEGKWDKPGDIADLAIKYLQQQIAESW